MRLVVQLVLLAVTLTQHRNNKELFRLSSVGRVDDC